MMKPLSSFFRSRPFAVAALALGVALSAAAQLVPNQWGLFDADRSWVTIEVGGTNTAYSLDGTGTPVFQGANLGTIDPGDSLTIVSFDVKAWKNGGDIMGCEYWYKIDDGTPVSMGGNSVLAEWAGDYGSTNQKWGNANVDADVASSLGGGRHTLTIYGEVSGRNANELPQDYLDGGTGPDWDTLPDGNGTTTYTAHFTVNGPSAVAKIVGGDSYPSLADAIAAAAPGAEIKLLADDDVSFASVTVTDGVPSNGSIVIDKNLTIDGRGCTVTGVSDAEILNATGSATPGYDMVADLVDGSNLIGFFVKSGNVTFKDIALTGFGDKAYVNKFGYTPIQTASAYEGELVLEDVCIDKFNRTAVCIRGGILTMTGGIIDANATNKDVVEQGKDHFQQPLEIRGGIAEIDDVAIVGGDVYGSNGGGAIVAWSETTVNNAVIDFTGVGIWADYADIAVTGTGTSVKATDKAVFVEDGGSVSVEEGDFEGRLAVDGLDGSAITVTGGTFDAPVPAEFAGDGLAPTTLAEGGKYTVKTARTVTFASEKGSAPEAQMIADGETATEPEAPETAGYTFGGWFAPGAEIAYDFTTPVTADLTLTAAWSINSHQLVITYVTPDGIVTPEGYASYYDYGEEYRVDSPEVEGCTPDVVSVSGAMGDEDISATVTYTLDKHTVTFEWHDGSSSAEYDYGTAAGDIAKPRNPAPYVEDGFIYTFDAWTPEIAKVTADATYTATYTSAAAVAKDNLDNYYASLADAVAGAPEGGTVTLLAASPLAATVAIDKNLTIDLDGNDIAATGCRALWVKAGNVAITGHGTISADEEGPNFNGASSVIRVGDSVANTDAAALSIGADVTVATETCYGVTVFGKNDVDNDPATLDISFDLYGTVAVTSIGGQDHADAAISGNGHSSFAPVAIAIHDGAVVSSENTAAIYFPGAGTLATEGDLTGTHGIVARAGSVAVNGGSVTATGTGEGEILGDSNEIVVPYAAIAYTTSRPDVWQHYVSGDKATINGGTVSSAVAPCVLQIAAEGDEAAVSIPAGSAALFSDAKAEGVPEGYALVESESEPGFYAIAKVWTVSFVNEKGEAPEVQTVVDGETATEPEAPDFTGWTCTGWTLDGAAYDFATPVTADITLEAAWKINTYTITWLADDGSTVIDTTSVEYGTVPDYEAQTKAATDEYAYTWAGWTPAPVAATADASYTAGFTATSLAAATWVGGASGDWQDPANWDIGFVPTKATVVTFADDAEVALDLDKGNCKAMVLDGAEVTLVRTAGQTDETKLHLHFWGDDGKAVSGTGTLVADNVSLFNGNTSGALTIGTALSLENQVMFKGNQSGGYAGSFTVTGKTTVADGATVKAIDNETTTFAGGIDVPQSATATFAIATYGHFIIDSAVTLAASVHASDPATTIVLPTDCYSLTANGSIATDSPDNTYVKKVVSDGKDTYSVLRKRTVYVGAQTGATLDVANEQRVAPDEELAIEVSGLAEGYEPSVTIAKHSDGSELVTTNATSFVYTMPDFDVDISVIAVPKTFTVTFEWHDGSSSAEYDYGTAAGDIAKPRNPAPYAEDGFIYTFDAWTPEIAKVTADATYTATYTSAAAVAKDNLDNYYASLADAVAGAPEGGTVTLLAASPLGATVTIGKDLTIDLDGNDIAATGCRALWVKAGNVAITGNGTISADEEAPGFNGGSSVIRVGDSVANTNAAALSIGADVTVATETCYGVTVFGKNDADGDPATADISFDLSGTVAVTSSGDADAAISGQGRSDYLAVDITIHDGAVVSSANSAAIYFPGAGTLTTEGVIAGLHGIVARAGNIAVNGGSVTATGTGEGEILGDSNEIVVPYAAIAYTTSRPDVWQHYVSGDKATINGGTVSSAVAPCVLQIAAEGDAAAVLIPADSTALFSDAEAEGVPEGYALVASTTPGFYAIAKVWTVAFVNEKGEAPEAQTVVDGATATEPDPAPECAGWNFDGWFAEGATEAFDFDTAIDEDLVLTAAWTEKLPADYRIGDNLPEGIEWITVTEDTVTVRVVVPEGATASLLAASELSDEAAFSPVESVATDVEEEGAYLYTELVCTRPEGDTMQFFRVKLVR